MDFLDEFMGAFPPARGRKAVPVAIEYVRDLNESDAAAAALPAGIETQPLKRLRQTHHTLARLMADGVSNEEASAITGYSPSRISVLKQDPAFQQLMAYYESNKEEIYLDVHKRLADLGMSTLEELQERLEDDPSKFTNRELMEFLDHTLDRAGFSKTQKVSIQTHVSVDLLSAVKAEVANRKQSDVRVINASQVSERTEVGTAGPPTLVYSADTPDGK